jgi:predicted ATP-dependent Lon-type protease
MKWEYAVKDYHGPLHHQLPVRVSVKADEIEKALNQLGTDGWELVSVNRWEDDDGQSSYRVFLKRPITAA